MKHSAFFIMCVLLTILVGCSKITQTPEPAPVLDEKTILLPTDISDTAIPWESESKMEETLRSNDTGNNSAEIQSEPDFPEKPNEVPYLPVDTTNLEYRDAGYYGQFFWLLCDRGILQMNLENEEISWFSGESGSLISVRSSGVYLLKPGTLTQIYFNSEVIHNLPLPDVDLDRYSAFDVGDSYAVYALSENNTDTDRLFAVQLNSGETKEIPIPRDRLYKHLTVTSISSGQDDTFYITVAPDDSVFDAEGQFCLYVMNAKSAKIEEKTAYQAAAVLDTDFDLQNNLLYFIGTRNGEVCTHDLRNHEEQIVSLFEPITVTTNGFEHPLSFSRIFFSGNNYILWSKIDQNIQIIKADTSPESINIILSDALAARYNINALVQRYRDRNVHIKITTYSDNTYDDKLRLKLLAGDDDFDIFLLSLENENAYLWDIIRNNAFEPLDGYACFLDNKKQMFQSLQNMMTDFQGRTYGIPLSFANRYSVIGCTDEFRLNGIDYPQQGWTISDFFDFCEQVKNRKIDELYVCSNAFLNTLVLYTVQTSVYNGQIDEEKLLSVFEQIEKYSASGLFYDETEPVEHYLIRNASLIPNRIRNTNADITAYRNFPSIDGMTFEYMMGCAMVNPKSNHKNESASFLAFITSPEIIYGNKQNSDFGNYIADCYIYPGYDQYKNFDIDEFYTISFNQKIMFDRLDDIPGNLRVLTLYPSAIQSYDVVLDVLNGKLSGKEAADMVIKNVNYRYFE